MNKLLKYSLLGVSGLVALVLVGVAIFAATFNPNDYKSLIIKTVQEKKQRTLHIDGDIKLAFWPKIGADLGKVSISEHKGEKEFAAIDGAKVFLAVMPLLKKELVIDTIKVDGVRANIVRFKDGTTNFDDLISKDEEESQDIKFDVDGVLVTNAAIQLNDEMGNRHFKFDNMNLKTGHIAKNEPIDLEADLQAVGDNPKINAKLQLKGTLLADTEKKQYGAKGLDFALQGSVDTISKLDLKISGDVDAKPETTEFMVDGLKLAVKAEMQGKQLDLALDAPKLIAQKDEVSGKEVNVSLTSSQGDDKISAKLKLADLKGSPKAFESSGISGDISGKQGARNISGTFSSPFKGNLETLVFDLPKFAGNVDIKDPALPSGAAKLAFNINSHIDAKKELANVTMNANIDGSNIKGDVAIAGFKQSNVKFNLSADKLDLNKLLGSQKSAKASPPASQPPNLSALKTVLAQGSINISSLLFEKYNISNLAATIKADGKTLQVSPLTLKLDDSQIKGSFGISQFERALYTFDIEIDQLDAEKYASTSAPTKESKPADLSALKALNANGSLRIGSLKYGKTRASNIKIDFKADGQKLNLSPFQAKIDDSNFDASLGISHFNAPVYTFKVNIDKLDADKYITKGSSKSTDTGDAPIDLSALKTLNATGAARIGWLKLANIKTSNVALDLKAEGGQVALAPFAANLYEGNMSGSLNVDARSTPSITFKQEMKSVAVGQLMVDAINNDMLEGKGTVSIEVKTQGATVNSLKKALNGKAALNLADGALKGVDIAGSLRELRTKLNVFKDKTTTDADKRKKTDFSELTATFDIKNGVAHNEDLAMKAPILRLAKGDSKGDIDIANQTINYTAKPTVVKSLKGQGGKELDDLSGIAIPIKISGTFTNPKYGMDFAAIGLALAKSNVLEKVGGDKGGAVGKLLGGDKAGALEGLLGGKKEATPAAAPAPAEGQTANPAPAAAEAKPKSVEEQAKEKAAQKLKNLLKF